MYTAFKSSSCQSEYISGADAQLTAKRAGEVGQSHAERDFRDAIEIGRGTDEMEGAVHVRVLLRGRQAQRGDEVSSS